MSSHAIKLQRDSYSEYQKVVFDAVTIKVIAQNSDHNR